MDAATAPPGGLLAALRAMRATLGEAACVRGSLFAIELREEIERRKQMLALGALAFALLHTAFLLLTALVAVAFWDTHRVAAVGSMAIAYVALGAGTLLLLRSRLAAGSAPFAGTLGELERDFAQLRSP